MNWKQLNRWGFGFVLASCVVGSAGAMDDDKSIYSRSSESRLSEMPELSDTELQDLIAAELKDNLTDVVGYVDIMKTLDTVRAFALNQKAKLLAPVDDSGVFYAVNCYNNKKGSVETRKIRKNRAHELDRVRTKNGVRIHYCDVLLERVAAERTRCFKEHVASLAQSGSHVQAAAEQAERECFARSMSIEATRDGVLKAQEQFKAYLSALTDMQRNLACKSPMGSEDSEDEKWRNAQLDAVACSLESVNKIIAELGGLREVVEAQNFHPDMVVDRVPMMSLVLDNKWPLLTSGLLTATMVCIAGVPFALLWVPAAVGGVINGFVEAVSARRNGATPMGTFKRGTVGALGGSFIAAGSAAVVSPAISLVPVPTEVASSVKLFAGGVAASTLRDVGSHKAWRARVKSAAFAGGTGLLIGSVFDLVAWWARLEQAAAQLALENVKGVEASRLIELDKEVDRLGGAIEQCKATLRDATVSRDGVQAALNACDTAANTCLEGTKEVKGTLVGDLQYCRDEAVKRASCSDDVVGKAVVCSNVTPITDANAFIEHCSAEARRLHPCGAALETCIAEQAEKLTLESAEAAVSAASKHLEALEAQQSDLVERMYQIVSRGTEGFCADELAQCKAKVTPSTCPQGEVGECASATPTEASCSAASDACVGVVRRAANPSAPEKISEFFDSAVGRLLPAPMPGNLVENAAKVVAQSATEASEAVREYDWSSWVPSMPEWLRLPEMPSLSWPSFLSRAAEGGN